MVFLVTDVEELRTGLGPEVPGEEKSECTVTDHFFGGAHYSVISVP